MIVYLHGFPKKYTNLIRSMSRCILWMWMNFKYSHTAASIKINARITTMRKNAKTNKWKPRHRLKWTNIAIHRKNLNLLVLFQCCWCRFFVSSLLLFSRFHLVFWNQLFSYGLLLDSFSIRNAEYHKHMQDTRLRYHVLAYLFVKGVI